MTELKGNNGRPLVTFILFAYNQEAYIREAVEGAFAQTYEPLEIILSDDCSTDRTFSIMQEMVASYDGRHRVSLGCNQINLGLASHVNAALKRSHGEIILLAAGDDVSLPNRAEYSVEIFRRNPDAAAVTLSADISDGKGVVVGERYVSASASSENSQNIQDLLSLRHVTFGPSRAIRRDVFEKFPPLREDCPTEDTTFLLRSLICGVNMLSPHKGVVHRKHGKNLSGPDSMKLMDVTAIHQQYSDDIEMAFKKGLVNLDLKKKLFRWISHDRKMRGIKLKVANGESLCFSEFIFSIRRRSLGFAFSLWIAIKHVATFKLL